MNLKRIYGYMCSQKKERKNGSYINNNDDERRKEKKQTHTHTTQKKSAQMNVNVGWTLVYNNNNNNKILENWIWALEARASSSFVSFCWCSFFFVSFPHIFFIFFLFYTWKIIFVMLSMPNIGTWYWTQCTMNTLDMFLSPFRLDIFFFFYCVSYFILLSSTLPSHFYLFHICLKFNIPVKWNKNETDCAQL